MIDRIYQVLLWGLLLAAPLAVGGVHTRVVIGLGGAVFVTWAVQAWLFRERGTKHITLSIPSLAFWLLSAICLLQIAPLPSSVVELLSPQKWSHFEHGWALLFPAEPVPHPWMPLSLDPVETADRGLRWLVLAMVALVGANHGRLRRSWRDVLRACTVSGLVVLAMGTAQVLSGTDRVLFLYVPQASLKPYTTFISPNHAAVFFGLSALCAFALALRSFSRSALEAALASLAGVILMVAMSEQDSVGATIGFWLAMVALFGFFLQSSQSRRLVSKQGARILAGILFSLPILTPLLTFLAWRFGPNSLTTTLMNSKIGRWIEDEGGVRLELMSAALEASGDYLIFGAGAGATENVLSPYIDWTKLPVGVVPTIENEPLEWFFHFGWAFGLAALVLMASYLVYAFRGQRRGHRLRYSVALAIGLFLAFNAQFHFPFFALGIAIPVIVLLEVALVREAKNRQRPLHIGQFSASGSIACWAPLVVGLVAFIVFAWSHDAIDKKSQTFAMSVASGDELTRRLRLIPSDGELYARVARQAYGRGHHEHAVDLAQYAARLEPTAKMQLFLAEILWESNHSKEAIGSYQSVFGPESPKLRNQWIRDFVVPTLGEPEAVAAALERASPRQWRIAAHAIRQQFGTTAEQRFALQLLENHSDAYTPHELLIRNYLRGRQNALAEMWSRLMIERQLKAPDGKSSAAHSFLIRALWQQGKRGPARDLLWQTFAEMPANEELAKLIIWYRTNSPIRGAGREVEAVRTLEQGICSTPATLSTLRQFCWIAEGWLAERDGRLEDAEFAYERVARKLGHPRPVAEFYVRRGMCEDLNGLISRLLRSDHPQAVSLQAVTNECAQTKMNK